MQQILVIYTAARNGASCQIQFEEYILEGGASPLLTNTIDFVTIATTGNATDFGDIIVGGNHYAMGWNI